MNAVENDFSHQTIWQQMAHLGYHLLPKTHSGSPGHIGLLVAMRCQPTRQHFDPETLSLRLATGQDSVKLVTLKREGGPVEARRICPGQVVLADRIRKEARFFAFGGMLDASLTPDETIYVLTSPGPVLDLNNDLNSFQDSLFVESRALLAQWAAAWSGDEQGFYQRLVQTDPLRLYLACVQAILERYRRCQALQAAWRSFYLALSREHTWLVRAGYYLGRRPSLEELLAPAATSGVAGVLP